MVVWPHSENRTVDEPTARPVRPPPTLRPYWEVGGRLAHPAVFGSFRAIRGPSVSPYGVRGFSDSGSDWHWALLGVLGY